jgi:hypothetical protein
MCSSLALLLLTFTAGEEGFTQLLADEKSPPSFGQELTKEEALAGWIALFDGETTFGFRDAKLEMFETRLPGAKFLAGGTTTSPFHSYTLKIEVIRPGKLRAGEKFSVDLPEGLQLIKIMHPPAPLRMTDGLAVRRWSLKPDKAEPLMNGQDLTGWKAIPYPKVAAGTKVSWEAKNGFIHALGGPGALEYQGLPEAGKSAATPPLFQDFLLQADVRTAARHTNGGIFLRNQPGTVMMGYEAQLHNRVYDTRQGERGCCTGSVDDRQHARRLVCRDGELFRMTALIAGPHISIWVNGYQTCDWTDSRPPDENPRRGLRLEGGTLQLQAHDPETDLEFHQVLVDRY